MKHRFVVENNKIILISEHSANTALATNNEVYTGTVEWGLKNLPLLGIDIKKIYDEGLAIEEPENDLKVIALTDHPMIAGIKRKFHVRALPIHSAKKFFVVIGVVRHYEIVNGVETLSSGNPDVKVDMIGDNTTEVAPGVGEYDYYQSQIEAGTPLLDLVSGGVQQRDSEGRFNNIY